MAILRHLGCLVLGVVVALGTVAVHRSVFPLGLLLGLGTTFAVVGWLLVSPDRRLTASYAAGWLVLFVLLLPGRPEGDYAIRQDVPGYALLAIAVLVLGFGLATLPRPGGGDRRVRA